MTTEVSTKQEASVSLYGQDYFDRMTKSGDYLDRLQLFTSQTEACKKKKISTDHWGIVSGSGNPEDLGEEVDVFVCAWRPAAKIIGDEILQFFNPDSPEFKQVEEKAATEPLGYMSGPEFLLFVPSVNKFATLMCANKTFKKSSADLAKLLGKAATFRSKLIEGKKYTWTGPEFLECNTPFKMPDSGIIEEMKQKFLNEKSSEVKQVTEEETSTRER